MTLVCNGHDFHYNILAWCAASHIVILPRRTDAYILVRKHCGVLTPRPVMSIAYLGRYVACALILPCLPYFVTLSPQISMCAAPTIATTHEVTIGRKDSSDAVILGPKLLSLMTGLTFHHIRNPMVAAAIPTAHSTFSDLKLMRPRPRCLLHILSS